METFCRVHEPRQPVPSGKPEHCAVSLTSLLPVRWPRKAQASMPIRDPSLESRVCAGLRIPLCEERARQSPSISSSGGNSIRRLWLAGERLSSGPNEYRQAASCAQAQTE